MALAPEIGKPVWMVRDELVSPPNSRQATPIGGLGFMPLTREVTPLHSSLNRNGCSEDLRIALQKLFEQSNTGLSSAVGADTVLTDQATYKPPLGMSHTTQTSPLIMDEKPMPPGEDASLMPAFIVPGTDDPRVTLEKVSEEAASCDFLACGLRAPVDGSMSLPGVHIGTACSESPWPASELGSSGQEGLWGSSTVRDDQLPARFLSTPETTPLHLGLLPASRGESAGGRAGLSETRVGAHPAMAAPPPPMAALPSVGSAGHPLLCARPCKYAGKPRGCKDGKACARCHLCPWRRFSEKQAMSGQGPMLALA
eukprot:CAMPEP_0179181682 /NCGR_PEP_ID=MMETSP0796-20121207/89992_1 /TAXON_ID=73915 /ORGANISM="Pyrodinium bahamense, Strain pbaha01" /LENGTH=311 /DNA_ID=CAMNT_0020885473 /DNA_START=11 /DNA_END=946 /DNA_ORIENTATION=-